MLMIFLMAILSLDLLHYSSQNRTSSPIESRASHGQHKYLLSNDIRGPGTTTQRISTSKSRPKGLTTPASPTSKKPKKKIIVRKRKATQNDTTSVANVPVMLSSKRPTPKSDTLMPFYAAQPMAAFDISYHHPIYENYNPLVNGILNMNEHPLPMQQNPAANQMPIVPIVESIPFKQLDPQHFQPIPPPGMQKIPLLDPFNVLKQRKPVRFAGKPKFLPVVRALPQITTTLPPITVTHIYKYEETNSGLPFENDDFVDNFPAISVALDDHLNDRAADIARLKGMMIPPKLHQQPIYYNMPVVELSTLAPVTLQNAEFDILHKFNEAIKSQNNQQLQQLQQQQQNSGQSDDQQFEYDEDSKESQDDKSYSDDDVKKALKYIQTLKKNRPSKPNRGSKKFDLERPQGKKRNKGKKEESEESFEEVEEYDPPKKSNKHKSPDFSAEDDNFTIVSFDELDGGESHKKVVKSKKKIAKPDAESASKADTIDNIGYQESQIVPSLDHEDIQEYSPPPDFSQNANLGGENNEDRIEFQMHGLRGPESYKFGYDTGKGENRQFRYEERDPDGRVKGHFGYYDKDGKLQVFNYEADPEHGYHLEQANQK